MTLPTNVNFGWVTGTFMDLAGTLCSGTVTFTATPTRILDATATAPTTIVPQPITATLSGGTFSQKLVATDDTDLNPTGFTYTVSFNLLSGTTPLTVDPFSISVPTSDSFHPLDLTIYTPVASANGVAITRGIGVPDPSTGTEGQAVILRSGVPVWDDQSGTGGGGSVASTDITDASTVGRSVLTAANAAAARTAISGAAATHTHAESDITGLTADLASKAPLASPALTGNPTAPTQTGGDSSTKIATTAFVAAAVAGVGGGGGGGGTGYARGMVDLDSFAGANDTAKLSAAMSYCAGQTYRPLISLEARDHTFTTALGKAYDGFGLVGANRGWGNAETSHYRTRVNLTIGANSFLDVTGTNGEAWNWYLEGFDIRGSSTATLVTSSGSGAVLWASTFRNITVQGLKGVFGNSSSKLLVDLITVDGQWEILNCVDTYVNVGGGDVRGFFADGGNFGCGSTADGAGKYQMIFGGYSKGNVGGGTGLYITADNGWRGLKVTGSQSSGYGFDINQPIIEGRNNGSPCNGNLILITGGSVNIWGGCVNDGMASPSAGEHGLIEVNGTSTEVSVFGTSFAHCSAVANTMPVIYATGTAGQVSVSAYGLKRGLRSSNTAWSSQRPRVQQTVTGLVLGSDSTLDLYTHA